MSNDDRLTRYLSDQARTIALAPADPAEVARRGGRRRTRRRVAVVGCAAILGVVATTVAVDRGDGDREVDSDLATSITPSSFDWTVVQPTAGLGSDSGTAALADGSLYSLSTAPGVPQGDAAGERHLYRSTDGTEWAEVSLPDGVRPSSLTGGGSTLYALGTAPAAGGGEDLVLSSSTDGAQSWSQLSLPDDVAALEAQYPGEITVFPPSVAATDASHVVAAVVVMAQLDLDARVPEYDPSVDWYELTEDGVEVYRQSECDGERCVTTTGVDGSEPQGPVQADGSGDAAVVGTYTWDELGIEPDLQELVAGRPYVYRSDDGATFAPVPLPAGTVATDARALATDDGFHLFLGSAPGGTASTSVLSSPDGTVWTPAAGSPLPGALQSVGVLGGRPAAALWTFTDHGSIVRVSQPDGTWSTIDPALAVDGEAMAGEIVFGPLGMAAVVGSDTTGKEVLVHSLDGSSLSAVSLAEVKDGDQSYVIGLDVTADAILVRLSSTPDGNSATAPTQRVLVGTPPG